MHKQFMLFCLLIGMLTAGCGSTSEELAITMVAQTDVAAIQTHEAITDTPVPTNTPVLTETQVPTETPTFIPTALAKTSTAALATTPLATPEEILVPQQWNGWLSYGSAGTQNLSFIIDKAEGSTFSGKMVWQPFGKRAKGAILKMHGEFITDFGDSWEQKKWAYHEDYKNGDRSGTWLKWTETEIIEGAYYTVNGWYYAHIREDGTMMAIYFYSADATIPSNVTFMFTLVQP
jgi:hypothetical protein